MAVAIGLIVTAVVACWLGIRVGRDETRIRIECDLADGEVKCGPRTYLVHAVEFDQGLARADAVIEPPASPAARVSDRA